MARASLIAQGRHALVGTWMVEEFGEEVLPDLVGYFQAERRSEPDSRRGHEKAGLEGAPVLLAAIDNTHDSASALSEANLAGVCAHGVFSAAGCAPAAGGLQHLISLNDPTQEDRIEAELRGSLAEPDPGSVVDFLNLIGRWQSAAAGERCLGCCITKPSPCEARGSRAGQTWRCGVAAGSGAIAAQKDGCAAPPPSRCWSAAGPRPQWRSWNPGSTTSPVTMCRPDAARTVGGMGGAGPRGHAQRHREANRKNHRKTRLSAGIMGRSRDVASAPLEGRRQQTLARRGRVSAVSPVARRPDPADVEAAPMYGLLDRSRSGEFSHAVLRGFLASGQDAADRWAMALVGLLGDDRIVGEIVAQIRDWVDHNRGKLAEYAVQALALLGSDVALVAVDAMAIRYRSKMKNVGRAAAEAFVEAAAAKGVTPEELGDRVVPWLGFAPGKPRIIEAAKSRVEAGIGLDFKLTFRDLEKKRPVKSLPKTASKEVLQEFKDLSVNFREIVKAQLLRLENLLVRQRRWPVESWRELFLQHPLLLPFAVRLVWGHYDDNGQRTATFRALEDRSLTTNEDEPVELGTAGSVGMIHPLELTDNCAPPGKTIWRITRSSHHSLSWSGRSFTAPRNRPPCACTAN